MRIGINGFGRIGRLVFRALWGRPGIELVHVNDPAGDASTAAHLLEFDSVHGRWERGITSSADGFSVEGSALTWSSEKDPTAVPWSDRGVEMVLEASGKIKTPETLNPYFEQVGLKRVVVACVEDRNQWLRANRPPGVPRPLGPTRHRTGSYQ